MVSWRYGSGHLVHAWTFGGVCGGCWDLGDGDSISIGDVDTGGAESCRSTSSTIADEYPKEQKKNK